MKRGTVLLEPNEVADEHNAIFGCYVENIYLNFKVDEQLVGKAAIQITNESWLNNNPARVGDSSLLIEAIHFDYNDEMNWNELTLYEYLEDALISVSFTDCDMYRGKTIAVLHKISIENAFRGQRYFSPFFQDVIHLLKEAYGVDIVLLQPHPFGENCDVNKGKAFLKDFYSRFGFVEVPLDKKMQEGTPYMQKSVCRNE